MAARTLVSEQELADNLGVSLKELDATVRKDLLLGGDEECYRKVKKASDGFEHGFLAFDELRTLSRDVRKRMADFVRTAILDLCGLEGAPKTLLLAPPFLKPIGYWPVAIYVCGRLLGNNSQLAAEGSAYPFLRWKPLIKKCDVREDGKVDLQISETFTAELGEGIKFESKSYEAWKPE